MGSKAVMAIGTTSVNHQESIQAMMPALLRISKVKVDGSKIYTKPKSNGPNTR